VNILHLPGRGSRKCIRRLRRCILGEFCQRGSTSSLANTVTSSVVALSAIASRYHFVNLYHDSACLMSCKFIIMRRLSARIYIVSKRKEEGKRKSKDPGSHNKYAGGGTNKKECERFSSLLRRKFLVTIESRKNLTHLHILQKFP
jgi:hypothetical protein